MKFKKIKQHLSMLDLGLLNWAVDNVPEQGKDKAKVIAFYLSKGLNQAQEDSLEKRYAENAPKTWDFMIDGGGYSSLTMSLTGAEIKQKAEINPTYNLYMESAGGDLTIDDHTTAFPTGDLKKFYTIPTNINGG